MIKQLRQQLKYHFDNPNYLYFLISLVLLVTLSPFASFFKQGAIFFNLIYALVISMAVIFTTTNMREFAFFLILGGFTYCCFLFREILLIISPVVILSTLLFFALVFYKLVSYVIKLKDINANAVFACISGYLILGVTAAPLFFMVELNFPDSFILPENWEYYDFIYFSFVTLTTVGYGDISPIHPLAKSFTILISIMGQLYLTILIAIVIGKYLGAERLKHMNNE